MSSAKQNWFAFDWDGTLVDCRERQVAVLSEVLARFSGAAVDLDAWWGRKREGMSTQQSLIAGGLTPPVARAVTGSWIAEVENERWLKLDVLFPQAVSALNLVLTQRFAPVVITARKNSERVRSQIRNSSVGKLVEDIWVVNPRDAAQTKGELLLQNRVRVFVGDTESDFFAAQMAGTLFGAVSSGQRSANYLSSAGVPRIFPDVHAAAMAFVPFPWAIPNSMF
jgi:phosphoglycolate phosphatase-like HAD superfamily hydrolase